MNGKFSKLIYALYMVFYFTKQIKITAYQLFPPVVICPHHYLTSTILKFSFFAMSWNSWTYTTFTYSVHTFFKDI